MRNLLLTAVVTLLAASVARADATATALALAEAEAALARRPAPVAAPAPTRAPVPPLSTTVAKPIVVRPLESHAPANSPTPAYRWVRTYERQCGPNGCTTVWRLVP